MENNREKELIDILIDINNNIKTFKVFWNDYNDINEYQRILRKDSLTNTLKSLIASGLSVLAIDEFTDFYSSNDVRLLSASLGFFAGLFLFQHMSYREYRENISFVDEDYYDRYKEFFDEFDVTVERFDEWITSYAKNNNIENFNFYYFINDIFERNKEYIKEKKDKKEASYNFEASKAINDINYLYNGQINDIINDDMKKNAKTRKR